MGLTNVRHLESFGQSYAIIYLVQDFAVIRNAPLRLFLLNLRAVQSRTVEQTLFVIPEHDGAPRCVFGAWIVL